MCSVEWQFLADVAGKSIGPIFNVQESTATRFSMQAILSSAHSCHVLNMLQDAFVDTAYSKFIFKKTYFRNFAKIMS